MANVVVNRGTKIGDGVIMNTGSIIDHDCVLDSTVHVCPRAVLAGNVVVGTRSWIGVGSTIRNGITIGKDVTVGAGSVVVANVNDDVTVIGNPAKPYIHS